MYDKKCEIRILVVSSTTDQYIFSELIGFVSSGPVVAMELMGSDAVNQWRALLGPTDSAIARSEAPNSMRARFGTGMVIYVHYSMSSWIIREIIF